MTTDQEILAQLRVIVASDAYQRTRRTLLSPEVTVDPALAPLVYDAQWVLRQIDAILAD